MSTKRASGVIFAMAIGGMTAWIGCRGERATPMAVGGGPQYVRVSIDIAIDRLADARCAREEKCGNVGRGLEYDTKDQCLTIMRGKKTDDLRLENCPGGIKDQDFNECLSDIQRESCDNPLDSLMRLKECRSSEICFQ
ncbi:MAG: hypothetical protein HYV09_33175 [Deltaproteobacteria bacterium]|nr:hypothetical protein [Deltaproteobacteria bacterium]